MVMLPSDINELKTLLLAKDPVFWPKLRQCTLQCSAFQDLKTLSTLRRKALAQTDFPADSLPPTAVLRVALVGGFTFHPLSELIQHFCFAMGANVELWSGEYDNCVWEIMDESSGLYSFKPDFVMLMPPSRRFRYSGGLADAKDIVEQQLANNQSELWKLCEKINATCQSEVILCNFLLPCYHDPGAIRSRSLASEWNSLKWLNLQLGMSAPPYVHICDLEFLGARHGGLAARDDRGWFESKLPFSVDFACDVAHEIADLICTTRQATKKVLVLDLDNTLWSGTIGDDGLNGIDLGDTSSVGQCFKEFQRSILELHQRGILLTVCSKNDMKNAIEPFEKHPEMILRGEHIAVFKANWHPKSDNIREIAQKLSLTLDSLVFVDDNPAEIEIVRQFADGVSTILLGPDPSSYVRALKDSRLFEPRAITHEDTIRGEQYRHDNQRKQLQSTVTNFEAYLESLVMKGTINEFREVDVPRISQLINKSNQFNLTTKRRTEAEVAALIGSENICLSLRLKDRFGDLGLVSVVIATIENQEMLVDTWLMSCRVLKREAENFLMNEVLRQAIERGCQRVVGQYLPTTKNSMVSDFYVRMGFRKFDESLERIQYEIFPGEFALFQTKIEKQLLGEAL